MNIYLVINILYEKQIKTVSSMRLEGTYWNWVSGFKLLYSDDAKFWTGYSSNKDLDKVTHILNFYKVKFKNFHYVCTFFTFLKEKDEMRNSKNVCVCFKYDFDVNSM